MKRVALLGDARFRRAGLTTIVAGLASLASLVVTFLTVPALLAYLGPVQFGIYMTLATTVAALGWLDLGVGLGLMNLLTTCFGREDIEGARRYISNALLAILLLAASFGLLFALLFHFIPWHEMFKVSQDFGPQLEPSVIALAVCIGLAMPTSLAGRIQSARQRGYVTSLWDIGARVLTLGGVFIAIQLQASLPQILLIALGAPILTAACNGIVLLGFQSPWLRPSLAFVHLGSALDVVKKGGLFVLLQLVSAAAFGSDNIVILQILGPSAVSDYTVIRTFFPMAASATTIMLMPLWPAYGEALALGEAGWVRRMLRLSLMLTTLVSTAAGLTLVLTSQLLLPIWVDQIVPATLPLLLGLAAYLVVTTCGNALAMLLNAASVIRFQIATALVMGASTLVAKTVFGQQFGLTGVVWGTVVAYTVCSLLPTLFYMRRWLNNLEAG